MTTNITDFFEQLFDEEYDRNITDKEDMYVFWSKFCRNGTENDVNPDWCHGKVNEWITDELEQQCGWDRIYEMLRRAIYHDADDHYLLKCIRDKHQEWFNDEDMRLNQETLHGVEASVESEESSDEEQTDPVATVPRAIFTCSNCGITFHDYNVRCTCPDDVNPPDPDGDGIAD